MAFIPSLTANSRDLTLGASQSKGAQFYSSRQLTNLRLTLLSRDKCVSQSLCNPETRGAYKFNGGNQWPLLAFFRAFPCPIRVTFRSVSTSHMPEHLSQRLQLKPLADVRRRGAGRRRNSSSRAPRHVKLHGLGTSSVSGVQPRLGMFHSCIRQRSSIGSNPTRCRYRSDVQHGALVIASNRGFRIENYRG